MSILNPLHSIIYGGAAFDHAIEEERRHEDRAAGRGAFGVTGLAYSPELERVIRRMPAFPNTRNALQNADGSFRFAPLDDGTLGLGTYGIDSYGRFVAI